MSKRFQNNITLVGLTKLAAPVIGFEIHGCKDVNGNIERTAKERDAEFYSLYVKYQDGVTFAIADCETKTEAQDLKKLILSIIEQSNAVKFPNGFESWMETHHEVVAAITEALTADELEPEFQNKATRRREEQGMGGIYELAEELTNKFEQLNKGREWDGEFFDEVTEFLRTELNEEEE